MCDEARKIKDSKEATAEIFKDVRKEIKMASGTVCESLSRSARMINTSKEIAQVATTWAKGDKKIGRVIAKAMEEIERKAGHVSHWFLR
ncbi:hypothetical protein AB3S75_000009 [Citrus x aurantiifolia]